jgi:NodT family efflux transporter outer membrane factor (OMF) lipoprotein
MQNFSRNSYAFKALAAVSLLALLSACATVPQSSTLTPRKAEDLASSQTLAAQPDGAWPVEAWWQGFHDPQLNALIDEAFKSAPDLEAAQARIEKALAQSAQIKAGTQADASLNASSVENKQSLNMGFPAAFQDYLPKGYWNLTKVTLDANYNLDLWGKSRAALHGAQRAAEAAKVDADAARLTLASTIVQAYVELNRLYDARDELNAMLTASNDRVALSQSLLQHQLATKDAVLTEQDQQAQLKGQIASVEGAIHGQQNLIAALIGAGPDRGAQITRPHLAPADISALPQNVALDLLGRRPDIAAAKLRVEAQAAGIKYAKADFYPNVNLTAAWGYQALSKGGLENFLDSNSNIGTFGPAISLPLFHQGRLNAEYRSYEADYDAAVASYDQTLTTAFRQVADAASATQATSEQLATARTRLDAAQQSLDLSKARFQRGLGTKLDVDAAQIRLASARSALNDLNAQAYNNRVKFIAALGGGYHSE